MMKLFYHILFIGINFNYLMAAICITDPNDPQNKALADGVVVMLGVVFFVLLCFVLFMYKLNKKSKEI